ncbi:hypothetical protein IC614_06565 [Allosphingosinicella flava]|uniref:Uncharacterized protein n=1 Tax=Allosphingosinicella flava TaxID=2771430 RepID=A0A7T2LL64_9SPHN|nr:hypothetical protein [Sphingosinicella flava]QPQ54038.1 hypothetical protein IC614_06565 [Sphingosinicella flava]
MRKVKIIFPGAEGIGNPKGKRRLIWGRSPKTVSKPVKTPPHSDIDGVHQDRVHVIDAANAAGQGAKELQKAKKRTVARPKGGQS